jgi:hypothetical protein
MALSASTVERARVPGAERRSVTNVTFDSSYAEGGEPLTPSELGLRRVTFATCSIIHGSESSTLRPGSAYYENEKLHLIDNATGKEVSGTSDMSKVVVQVVAFGK